jgi:uncharacterized protein YciI
MFLVLLVEKYIAEHVDYLDQYYEKKQIIFSGRKNPRTGGVVLVNSTDRAFAEEFIKGDPFYIHEVAKYEIIEFLPTKYDPRLASVFE